LIINLINCTIYKPIATIWINLAHYFGKITSAIILSVLFFVMVVPVGIFRRLIGLDSLALNQWKKDNSSVFKVREHTYEPQDLDNPY